MSELPPGWTTAKLAELLTDGPTNGYSPAAAPDAGGTLTLRLNATTSGRLILSESTTKRLGEEVPATSKLWLTPGDILVQRANTLEYVGTAALYDGPAQTYVYPDLMMRIRAVQQGVNRAYLCRFLNSKDARDHLRERATGTAGNMPKINGTTLRELPVVLPPLAEQRRIVDKLEDLLARSRRAKAALDAIPPLLDKLRQSVLAAAFRGDLTAEWRKSNPDIEPAEKLLERIRVERRRKWEETELARMQAKGKTPGDDRWKAKYVEPEPVDARELPELPEGWAWASVDEVSSGNRTICYGVVQPGDEGGDDVGVRLVRVCDLADGTILMGQLRTITREVDAEYERSRLRGGEVLVSVVGTIGRTALAPPEAAGANIARAVARVVAEAVPGGWLASWLASPAMQHQLNLDAREVARKTLNIDTLKKCAVPVGPWQEMAEADAMVRELQGWARNVEQGLCDAQGRQARLDRAILAKAFRGELVPQDPADEPAAAMLARLAAPPPPPPRPAKPPKRTRA